MQLETWPASIPNIHIGRIFDAKNPECDVHYETFERMAEHFGRNTPAHRHHGFYQLHILERGAIRLHLDEKFYTAPAPLLFLTPPSVPHALYSDNDTFGHVVTLRQDVVRGWHAGMAGEWPEAHLRQAAFLPLDQVAPAQQGEVVRLLQLVSLLRAEFQQQERGRSTAVLALSQLLFLSASRLIVDSAQVEPAKRSEDLRIFLLFCDYVEARFRDHITLSEYARLIGTTEPRLNDICRRLANLASKEVVHERLVQEARRLLRFTSTPISEIGYQLGFADPAYFSRFFARETGMPPKEYRLQHQSKQPGATGTAEPSSTHAPHTSSASQPVPPALHRAA